jgi:hypothetical protein
MSNRIYYAWAESSTDGPKVRQKTTEKHTEWSIGFNVVRLCVTLISQTNFLNDV